MAKKKVNEASNALYDLNLEFIDTGSGIVVTQENIIRLYKDSAANLKAA